MKKNTLFLILGLIVAFIVIISLPWYYFFPDLALLKCKQAFTKLQHTDPIHFQYNWSLTYNNGNTEHIIYDYWYSNGDFVQIKNYDDGTKDVSVHKNDTTFTLESFTESGWSALSDGLLNNIGTPFMHYTWDRFYTESMETKLENRQFQVTLHEYADACGWVMKTYWTFHFSLLGELDAISVKNNEGVDACYTFPQAQSAEITAVINHYYSLVYN